MTLLENTKKMAKERGLSLTDVATKAGIAQKSIYQWNRVTPKADTLKAVADVLGVSTDFLLGNTDVVANNNQPSQYQSDLKEVFDNNPILSFDGKEIPEAELKIIRRILEDMDD